MNRMNRNNISIENSAANMMLLNKIENRLYTELPKNIINLIKINKINKTIKFECNLDLNKTKLNYDNFLC